MSSRSRYLRRKYSARTYYLKKNLRKINKLAVNVAAVILLIVIVIGLNSMLSPREKKLDISVENVQAFKIPHRNLRELKLLSDKYGIEFAQLLAVYSIENNFFPAKLEALGSNELERNFVNNYEKIKSEYSAKAIEPYYRLLKTILEEIKYFPLPYEYDSDEAASYMFGDSWDSPRNYSGESLHTGTDITDRENMRGRIPIVSMSGGIIKDIGWNELGGFRIGIVTDSNTYYYYAHMDSFAGNLEAGGKVQPGQLLGYMGDSGYGKKEGTKGNFAVHLHIGISPDTELSNMKSSNKQAENFWINPYPFLRLIEDTKIHYMEVK